MKKNKGRAAFDVWWNHALEHPDPENGARLLRNALLAGVYTGNAGRMDRSRQKMANYRTHTETLQTSVNTNALRNAMRQGGNPAQVTTPQLQRRIETIIGLLSRVEYYVPVFRTSNVDRASAAELAHVLATMVRRGAGSNGATIPSLLTQAYVYYGMPELLDLIKAMMTRGFALEPPFDWGHSITMLSHRMHRSTYYNYVRFVESTAMRRYIGLYALLRKYGYDTRTAIAEYLFTVQYSFRGGFKEQICATYKDIKELHRLGGALVLRPGQKNVNTLRNRYKRDREPLFTYVETAIDRARNLKHTGQNIQEDFLDPRVLGLFRDAGAKLCVTPAFWKSKLNKSEREKLIAFDLVPPSLLRA